MDNVSRFVAEIQANIRNFERNIKRAQASAQQLPDELETEVDADISKFRRGLLRAQALAQRFESFDIVKTIDFHIRRDPFNTINFREFITEVDEMTDRFQHEMNRLARSIQSFGVVMSNQIRGVIISSLLSIIPIIGGVVAAVMAIGNALGVVVGAVGGFVGALGIAGLGAASYIGLIATVLSRYNDEAFEATEASNKFTNALDRIKSTWNEIVDNNMDAIFMTMGQAIYAANYALEEMTPFIDAVVSSMRGMTNELKNFVMNSPTMLTFFDNLNEKGVTVFENIVRGIGRFGQGIVDMFNAGMPLIEYIAQGFENLGERFSEWSARMREENGFQAFTEYVQENLPKIGSIFGSTFEGIINLFAAFGENSENIFDYLVEMSERFKTWSENIKQSDGFQKFIEYVQTNGPTIMSLIGNIVMMIVNFAIAVAPLAQKVLEVTTNITGWISEMLRAHPIIGQIIGVLSLLFGAFLMVVPVILQIRYVLIPLIAAFSKFLGITAILKTGLALLSAAFAFVSTPVTILVGVIATLTMAFSILYQKNETFRTMVQTVWSFIVSFITDTVGRIVQKFTQFREEGQGIFQAAWNTFKEIFIENLTTILSRVIAKFLEIKNNIQEKLEQARAVISSVWESIKSTIAQKIANILADITSKFIEIKNTIQNKIEEAKTALTNKMQEMATNARNKAQEVYDNIRTKISEVPGMVGDFISDAAQAVVDKAGEFVSAGGDIIAGLKEGIVGAAQGVIDAATGVVGDALGAAKSLLGIKSPSRAFMELGKYTSQGLAIGINRDADRAVREVTRMSNDMTKAYAPELTGINAGMDAELGSMNKDIRNTVDADITSGVKTQRPIVNVTVRNEGDLQAIRSAIDTEDGIDETLAF